LLICAGLWIWVVSSIEEVLANFFLTFEFNYIIIRIKLCRYIERKPELVAHVWSQLVRLAARMIFSLGASQEEAPTPPAPSTDAASSSAPSQHRGGVPSQWNQFTRKYEAQWKDDLSM